jgi:taurine dioxygenase
MVNAHVANSQFGSKAQADGQTDWPFEVKPLHDKFGFEIIGLSLTDAVAEDAFAKVYEAFLAYQLILFRDVDLPPATQVAFARRFGEVQVHVMNQYHGYNEHPEIYKLTNIDQNGQPNGKHPDKGTLYWHTDGSWRTKRGLATMMYSEVVPKVGGQTEFVDTYSAYDRLSDDRKQQLEGVRAIHNLDFSRTRRHGVDLMTEKQKEEAPPVPHPVIRVHPETGRKALFLGDHAESIEGMDYDAGRAMIDELNDAIAPAEAIYTHEWSPGECIVWDNRCTLHRAMGFDTANEIRVMRRCTTLGDTPQG